MSDRTSHPRPPGATRALADVLASTTYEDLPEEVLEHTRRSITDWLGSALGGCVEKPARLAQQVAAGLGASNDSTMFGAGRASAAAAAFANGVASHILELDDIHKGSTVHAAAPIIPAALAVAERQHADGRGFVAAVTIGYEAAFRIGEAVNPSHYFFFHPTGTVATFGAAAAAGSLLKLTADEMLDALGSAGTQAAALWEFNADGAMSKHLHPGKAAMNGILAADLARAGFTGATRILEGDRGFFRAMTGHRGPGLSDEAQRAKSEGPAPRYDETRVTDGLGTTWKIGENGYKLHSCCGHTHTAVDCALDIRSRRKWTQAEVLDAVGGVEIETYGPGYEIVKEMNPRTPYQGKFSLAYCVVAALAEGRVGLEQFAAERFGPNGVGDPVISELLRRTRVVVADDLTGKYPAAWPARLRVTLKDGTSERGASDYPRGSAEHPVSTRELELKFRTLIGARFGEDMARASLAAVHSMERCADMSTLFADMGRLPASASAAIMGSYGAA
jgi:2-methylcitrate dehydratase PrpD